MKQTEAPRPRRAAALGERVRRHREELGWTQSQLAAKAGLAAVTVSRVERGIERPVARTAEALSRALGLPAERLLGLSGQQPLFPLPDERRVRLVRHIVGLSDDDLERVSPAIEAILDGLEPGVARTGRRRKPLEAARDPEN